MFDGPIGYATGALGLNPSSWGPVELIIVLAIILLVFGPKRLPSLARSVGKSIKDFRRGLNEVKEDLERAGDEETKTSEGTPTLTPLERGQDESEPAGGTSVEKPEHEPSAKTSD